MTSSPSESLALASSTYQPSPEPVFCKYSTPLEVVLKFFVQTVFSSSQFILSDSPSYSSKGKSFRKSASGIKLNSTFSQRRFLNTRSGAFNFFKLNITSVSLKTPARFVLLISTALKSLIALDSSDMISSNKRW